MSRPEKICIVTRYNYEGMRADIQAFSNREKADRFITEQAGAGWENGGDFKLDTLTVDEFEHYRNRRYWWCAVNLATGKERTSGKRKAYDFVDLNETHTIKHSARSIEVRSYISMEHAVELARTEAAAAKMEPKNPEPEAK